MNQQTFTFTLYDRVAVVGRDPELADYSNPRGEILRVVYSVIAENAVGRRWVHYYTSQDRDRVSGLLRNIEAAHFAGQLPILSTDYWTEAVPAYGSEAYSANEDEIVAAERQRELDAA